jgi:hypothetical protein
VEVIRGTSKRNAWAMTDRTALLSSLPALRAILMTDSDDREAVIRKAHSENAWFTPAFTKLAIEAIAEEFLDQQKCQQWLSSYSSIKGEPKKVALIMAGNLPLVGFHDLLCVIMSGHTAVIKLSDKDSILLPWVINHWIALSPELSESITYTERLEGFDAVIATGSNNSARYFEYYFKSYPHILRQNRNGVAVLTGAESMEHLRLLGNDIFQFYGLGCRNVSKIFVPEGYDFGKWDEAMADWKYLEDHHKYKNNLEYNYAIYLINSIPHINLGQLILKEDEAIPSRIGSLHYSYYADRVLLTEMLDRKREEIQCVLSLTPLEGWEHVAFGESQKPHLHQYADGVDTMEFLTSL